MSFSRAIPNGRQSVTYSTVQLLGPLMKSVMLFVRCMREGWCE